MLKGIVGLVAAAGLIFAGCESRREEAVEKQQGVGGAGIYEEPGEESVFEVEPPAGQQGSQQGGQQGPQQNTQPTPQQNR